MKYFTYIFCIYMVFGCAGRIKSYLISGIVDDFGTATLQHSDPNLIENALPPLLLAVDSFLIDDPDNTRFLLSATEAYTSYATLIEFIDESRAKSLYERAHWYGRKLLQKKIKTSDLSSLSYLNFEKAINEFKETDIELVFWSASAWGGSINANIESMNSIAELPRVILLMEWVLSKDESFNDGGAHLFLGVFNAALPPLLGGKPKIAKFHFQRCMEITRHESLMPYVLKAEYYARQIFDQKMHDELLQFVINKKVTPNTKFTLQNNLAKQRAKLLLEESDDYF